MEYTDTPTKRTDTHAVRASVLQAGRFLLHLLEMTLAMMTGMPLFFALRGLIPATSSYRAALAYGTNGHDLAMAVFMTIPMTAWMLIRGHSRRHAAEMAAGMLAPAALVIVLRLFGAGPSLPWLNDIAHPATFLGMLAAMLYRREHYMGGTAHAAHAAHS